MTSEAVEVTECGPGVTIQDNGRHGWQRFGVPVSGAMDAHAATWANRLLDNAIEAPVLELFLEGAKLSVLRDAWFVITGSAAGSGVETWRTVRLAKGDVLQFPGSHSGVWTYVAVEGGFVGRRLLGSASVCLPAKLGAPCVNGTVLSRANERGLKLPPGIAGRFAPTEERREYNLSLSLKVWKGPQWDSFGEPERESFFSQQWTVTPESGRVSYRFSGTPLKCDPIQIIGEPVRVGSITISETGLPAVTMRDGPVVATFPKLGVLDPEDVSWLAQCRPGTEVRFEPAE